MVTRRMGSDKRMVLVDALALDKARVAVEYIRVSEANTPIKIAEANAVLRALTPQPEGGDAVELEADLVAQLQARTLQTIEVADLLNVREERDALRAEVEEHDRIAGEAEVKRAWRTRTKTTVLDGYQFQNDEEGGSFLGPRGLALSSPPRVLCDLVPAGIEGRKGKITVIVTFEPR